MSPTKIYTTTSGVLGQTGNQKTGDDHDADDEDNEHEVLCVLEKVATFPLPHSLILAYFVSHHHDGCSVIHKPARLHAKYV